jgi:hypothetical protein
MRSWTRTTSRKSSVATNVYTAWRQNSCFLIHDLRCSSDFAITQSAGLINKCVTWYCWQNFRNELLHHPAGRDVHDRYEHGELRLGRLNQIYRMKGLGLAYSNVYRDYSSYFRENYTTLVALFALVSVALPAMQVITDTDGVPTGTTTGSHHFAIGTLASLAWSCALLLSLYLEFYLWNWCMILIRHDRKKDRIGTRTAPKVPITLCRRVITFVCGQALLTVIGDLYISYEI